MTRNCSNLNLKTMLVQMFKVWGRRPLATLWKTRRLQGGMIRSQRRRGYLLHKRGLPAPMGIGLSPTARCNLSCQGCYARFHPREGEMSGEVIQGLIRSAREAGVFLFVITGGEPYLRPEMLEIYQSHRDTAFITVTNGTLIDQNTAATLAQAGNVFPMVSIEGSEAQTDQRRGAGVYRQVQECMKALRRADVLFGFSAVVTRDTVSTLGSDAFVGRMVERGCSIGFYNELVPLTPEELPQVPDAGQRLWFQERLTRLRAREPLMLVHLPNDEYDRAGRCRAVLGGGMHINAQGYVEPCPFAHFARENVKQSSFKEILASPFLEAIRRHPTALQHGPVGCSLVNNRSILEEIAADTGARPTNIPSGGGATGI